MSAAPHVRDELRTIGLLCTLAIVSDLSYSGLTPLVVAYGESLHFDLTTAGWLATAEGAGFTLGALLAPIGARYALFTRGRVAIAFLVLAAAQLLSASTTQAVPLAAYRVVSGTAAGLIYAVGLPAIAAGRHAERGFALYFGAIFVSGMIALAVIPTTLKWLGLGGFYVAYAALIVLTISLVRWYPTAAARAEGSAGLSGSAAHLPAARRRALGLLLASVFLNFVFNGGLWVLAEHFGLEIQGTDPQSLGGLLAVTMLFALAGTALATLVAGRLSQLTTIVLGNLGLILAVLIMSGWHTVAGLITAMAFLNMSVPFLTPATFAALAGQSEQGAQWGNLISQAGYSIGPAAIAAIAAHSGMSRVVDLSVAGFLGSAVFAWLGLAKRGHRGRSSGS